MMEKLRIEKILEESKAVLKGHFVLASGRHSRKYINKDAIYLYPRFLSEISREIFLHFLGKDVEVIAGPAVGGAILAHWVGSWYRSLNFQPLVVFSEENYRLPITFQDLTEKSIFRRGYDKMIPGKRVLVVDDVLTTGSSVKKVVEAVKKLEGKVIGVAVVVNRGNVTAKECGDIPELYALINLKIQSWLEEKCPLCRKDIPISTEVGRGKEFLAKKAH